MLKDVDKGLKRVTNSYGPFQKKSGPHCPPPTCAQQGCFPVALGTELNLQENVLKQGFLSSHLQRGSCDSLVSWAPASVELRSACGLRQLLLDLSSRHMPETTHLPSSPQVPASKHLLWRHFPETRHTCGLSHSIRPTENAISSCPS